MKEDQPVSVPQSTKSGLPPGTLIHVGDQEPKPTTIRVFLYDSDTVTETVPDSLDNIQDINKNVWIKLSGLSDLEDIKEIGEMLSLHPLTIEDIINTRQRPKYEEFDDYLFVVVKILRMDEGYISSEQLSIILSKGCICSFEKKSSDLFENIVKRLNDTKGRIRQWGPDYLMYTLIDCVVDNYFFVFENIGNTIEDLEERIIENPEPGIMEEIYILKRNLLDIRKQVWPVRETISGIVRVMPTLVTEKTGIFLNDVADHLYQINDMLESYREMATGLYEIYLSTISNRMNEVMKVLTIIATIFIPLTFIAGVYGMNFSRMPELEYEFGYPLAILSMVIVAGIMVVFFRKKKWL